MEIVISWMSVAYTLAEKQKTEMCKLNEAVQSYEKMKERFSQVKELIGRLSEKSDISEEELLTAQTYCDLLISKMKIRQRNLLLSAIEACLSSLNSIYHTCKSESDFEMAREIYKNLDQKIKETKLDSHLAKAYPHIFCKLECSIQRLRNLN